MRSTNGEHLRHTFVGGLQWGVTTMVVVTLVLAGLKDVLPMSNAVYKQALYGTVLVGFVAGVVWTSSRYGENEVAHRKRIEYLFALALWGVVIGLVLMPAFTVLGVDRLYDVYLTRGLSIGALLGYLTGLLFAYVLSYVLELRIFHRIFA